MRALAARLYEVLDERGPPWASVAIDYVEDPEALATRARDVRPRARRAIRALGVLVMQDEPVLAEELRVKAIELG